MEISVIIPTLNRAQDLHRCLSALATQRNHLHEIIVIDNGSTDATPDVAAKFKTRVIHDASRNLSKLFNIGWKQASGDVVAYLNDDSEPSLSWAEWVVRALSDDPGAAIIGGPTIDVNPRQIETLLARAGTSTFVRAAVRIYDLMVMRGRLTDIGLLLHTGGYSIGGYYQSATRLKGPIEVDQLTITNMAIKKNALSTLGGFDEQFLFNHADGDLFARARRAGLKLVFHPKVVVFHHANPAGPVRNSRFLGMDTARFLLRSVSPETWRDLLGWFFNVVAFNLFWIYKTFETGHVGQLTGILGFLQGLARTLEDGQ